MVAIFNSGSSSLTTCPSELRLLEVDILALHESLEKLQSKSFRKAQLVKLRCFAGCTLSEAAEILGISASTAEDDWTYAKVTG